MQAASRGIPLEMPDTGKDLCLIQQSHLPAHRRQLGLEFGPA
jgi:hypothetical protein